MSSKVNHLEPPNTGSQRRRIFSIRDQNPASRLEPDDDVLTQLRTGGCTSIGAIAQEVSFSSIEEPCQLSSGHLELCISNVVGIALVA